MQRFSISLATISAMIWLGSDTTGPGLILTAIDSAGCGFLGIFVFLAGPFLLIAVIFLCSAIICSARSNFGISLFSCIASSRMADGSFTSSVFFTAGREVISFEDRFRFLSSLFLTFLALLTAATSFDINRSFLLYFCSIVIKLKTLRINIIRSAGYFVVTR